MGVKIAFPGSQFREISHDMHQQITTKKFFCFESKQREAPQRAICGFAKENFQFWPFSHAKWLTHCPYPLPTTSNEQMGAYPFTLTHPNFLVGNTHYLFTHLKKGRVDNPGCAGEADLLVCPSTHGPAKSIYLLGL